MKVFRTIGKGVNAVGGGLVKGGVHLTGSLVGNKFPNAGTYIKDVGDTVVHSSRTVIENTTHFADGAANGLYGAVTKDERRKSEGWEDVKTATTRTAKGIGGGIVFTGKSVGQTVSGIVQKDHVQFKDGLKNLGKVGAVGALGVGLIDMVAVDSVEAMALDTRNMTLDGELHEVTGVPFESKVVEDGAGGMYEGVFPVFDAAYEMELPEDILQANDVMHIGVANLALYEEISMNPQLADDLGFTAEEIENLKDPVTPTGYDWHHHEDIGKMQLVDEATHQQTGHTGGRVIWGGGMAAR